MPVNKEIQAISSEAVHRICSGQVVLSLAIAVKELVENSIDAGARNIEIRVKNYGLDAVEVIDNGCGVETHNFEALGLKHYTSKIREFNDLENISTLGFRGEALSSLCALADLTVITRHESAECGTKLEFDRNGHIKTQSLLARSVGTTVQLSNLFITLPVRRKEFSRNFKREFHKMCTLLHAYCLVCTDIKFTCINQASSSRNQILSTLGAGSVTDNIINIFGSKQTPNLFEVALVQPDETIANDFGVQIVPSEPAFRFHFLISSVMHGCGRSATDRQFFYINSRPCESNKLAKLVNETYKLFNSHQFPFVFLNIHVLSSFVDVNVTPDKRQVYLEQEKLLLATIRMSLMEAFKNFPSTFNMQNLDLTAKNGSEEDLNVSKRKLSDSTTFLDRFRKKSRGSSNSDNEFELDKISCPVTPNKVFSQKDLQHLKLTKTRSNEIPQSAEIRKLIKPPRNAKKTTSNSKLKVIKSAQLSSDDSDNETIDSAPTLRQNNSIANADVTFDSPRENAWNAFKQITNLDFSLDAIRKAVNENESELNSGNQSVKVKFRCEIAPQSNKDAETELQTQFTKDMFKQMDIIGQFNHAFIVASVNHDLFIIDQHACDEIYNFEMLQRNTIIDSQALVSPKPLQLSAVDESILLENEAIFNKNGFYFDYSPTESVTNRIKLTKIPVSKTTVFGIDDIEEMIYMLKEGTDANCRPSRIRGMFAMRACRKSVMVGKALNRGAMRQHIDHMGDIEQPWNCPHGRPTMRHLINLRLIE